ncbi:MAG: DUF4136 domain-containing protein [Bacteroidota bacterium]
MNFRKLSAVGLLCVLLASCSSIDITTDYDPARDFSSYKTYRWAKGKERNPRNTLTRNTLLNKRVQFAVDNSLQSKGFEKLEKGQPDFIVIVYAGMTEKMQVYHQGGWYGGWWGPSGGYTSVSHYTEGTLVVDIVDRAEKELSWRGMATGVVRSQSDPLAVQEDIQYAIEEILYEFPPRR